MHLTSTEIENIVETETVKTVLLKILVGFWWINLHCLQKVNYYCVEITVFIRTLKYQKWLVVKWISGYFLWKCEVLINYVTTQIQLSCGVTQGRTFGLNDFIYLLTVHFRTFGLVGASQ